ncbi:MAG: asparagine synthase-related protein, partial [Sciscionella sp.]
LGLMSESLGPGIPAFTATFPGTRDEDRAFSIMAAERFGSPWHEVEVHEPTEALLDRLAWHFDEPFADPSAVPTFLVCEEARKHVTVCLSGDGGDETFGGYRRYRENEMIQSILGILPKGGASRLLGAAGRLAPDATWLPKPLRVRPLLRKAAKSPMIRYQDEMSVCRTDQKPSLYRAAFASALGGYDALSTVEACFARSDPWGSTSQFQYTDFKTFLADGILTKVDRASMAHGLEVRVPLLDHPLVEFFASLPSSSKIGRGRGKEILKKSLRHVVPSEILTRRKRGFTPPLAQWLSGGTGTLFERRVFHSSSFISGFLEMNAVRRVWDDHRAGIRSDTRLIWSILMLENWGLRFQ